MFIWRAYCRDCGYTEHESRSRHFMDDFFLPRNCNKCGSYKDGDRIDYAFDKGGWAVEFGQWVSHFKLFKPKTWFLSQTWQKKASD